MRDNEDVTPPDNGDVTIRNMFGHNTQSPLVSFRVGDIARQWEPADAEEVGFRLLEAAAACRADAAIVRTVQAITDGEARLAGLVLNELRKARSTQGRPLGKRRQVFRLLLAVEREAAERALAAAARTWMSGFTEPGPRAFAAALVKQFRAEYLRPPEEERDGGTRTPRR
jgi:hypothetical protein